MLSIKLDYEIVRIRLIFKAVIILIVTTLSIIFQRPDINANNYNDGSNTKIILIGIDGLEWSVINELIKEGKMPTFANLMREGSYGNLHTLLEYGSPSLWTTIATGKRPEIHGITQHIFRKNGEYETSLPRSYHRKVKALWNILTDYDKMVGVLNYQCTEPPETVNGFIIPYLSLNVKGELSDEITKIREDFFDNFNHYYQYKDDLSEELKEQFLNDRICRLSAAIPYLNKRFNKKLDLLMVYFYETDFISHHFWKFMKPRSFRHPAWALNRRDVNKFGSTIKDMYCVVDKFVKMIVEDAELIDKNTIIIICSDHGFQGSSDNPMVSFKDLNKLLEVIGFLNFKYKQESPGIPAQPTSEVDYSKSRAYHFIFSKNKPEFSESYISINLKRREAHGIVRPGKEYLKLKKDLMNVLSGLSIVETNEKLFTKVSDSPLAEIDICLELKYNISLLKQHIKINDKIYPLSDFYSAPNISGVHADPGVIIIYGKNIRKKGLAKDANILDITPTILYLLGLPVAEDMEGDVLVQFINEGFLKRNAIKYISSYELRGKPNYRKHIPFQPIDNQELEKMRSLGYVQ